MDHRRAQFRRGTSTDPEQLIEKRQAAQEQQRKEKRDQLLASKRRREDVAPDIPAEADIESSIQIAMQKMGSNNAKMQSEGLVQLRKITCNPSANLPLECIPLIIKFLQVGERHEEFQFEAIWCLTNIACANTQSAIAVLPSAPYLIRLLGSPSLALQEQSAWCLGNLAGESAECRTQLRANGAVRPLLQLLQAHWRSSPQQHHHQQHWRIARLAAFALSNMARPGGAPAAELLRDSNASLLLECVRATGAEELSVESMWLLANLLAGAPAENPQQVLVTAGAADVLVSLLPVAMSRDSLLTPLVRCIGQSLSRQGPLCVALTTRLIQSPPSSLHLLIGVLASQKAAFLKRETCWLLANLSALSPLAVDALVTANAHESLSKLLLLSECPHDTRHEAAVALTNMSADGRHMVVIASVPGVVMTFVSLVTSPDSRIAHLALSFLDLLLYYHPTSIQSLSSLPDTLQSLQFQRDQSLYHLASRMLQKYYGVVPYASPSVPTGAPVTVNVSTSAPFVFVPSM